MMNEETADRVWYAYENGTTIGRRGPETGLVLRDEEFGDPDDDEDADARLTLEKVGDPATTTARFTITANLYGGWLLHTAAFSSEPEARAAFDRMRPELEALADQIPDEGDRDIDARVLALNTALAEFSSRYA